MSDCSPSGCVAQLSLQNAQQLKQWILLRLGAPRWKLELHPCHLDVALDDALQWFLKYKGIRRYAHFTMQSGQARYPYPDDAMTIVDVIPPGYNVNADPVFAPYGVYQSSFGGTYGSPYDYNGGGPTSGYAQVLQYNKINRRVFSREFNWLIDHANREFIISPPDLVDVGTAMVEYVSGCASLNDLSPYDHDLVRKYALAVAREILGLIRRKYSRYPGLEDAIEMDGRDLVTEAREDMRNLEEKVLSSGAPWTVVTG